MTQQSLILEKYRLMERLGEGGMGTVFRARDELLDRDVAIKQLRPHLLSDDGLSERFRSEARVLARLSHPCIAALHGLERQDGSFYMVMEYLPGETLEALVARAGALPWPRAVQVATSVLDALQHAHEREIVHRDIKPANIMVAPDGGVKVMDFGIARVMGRTRHTRQGHAVGTPAYMSPEQLRGEEVDGRADLYALGMVLYEMLVGRVAFDADSDYRLMMMQLHDMPAPPGSVVDGIPPALDRVVARAMAKRPSDRYASAAAMRDALADVARTASATTGGSSGWRAGMAVSIPAAARAVLSRSSTQTAGWGDELGSWLRDWRGWATAGCLVAAAFLTVRALAPGETSVIVQENDTTSTVAADDGRITMASATGSAASSPTPMGGGPSGPGISWGVPTPTVPTGLAPTGAGSGSAPRTDATPDKAAPTGGTPTPPPAAPRATPPARSTATGNGQRDNSASGGNETGNRAATTPAANADDEPRESASSNESGLRDAAMATAAGFLNSMASGDAAAAAAISGDGSTAELSALVREKRVSGAAAQGLSLSMAGDRARATADVELTWRTAFGGNRRNAIQIAMELRRQGTTWRVESARMTGGALR